MKAILALALVLTQGPNTYELRTRAGTTVSRGHATEEACRAAITEPGEYRCSPTGVITAVGVCDPLPPPPPVIVDGFTIRGDYVPHACPNDHFSFTQVQPQRDPWPSCAWVDRAVPVVDCNGLQVAPMLEDADTSTTQVEEPGPWIEELDFPIGSPCPAEANGNCYVGQL